MYKDIHLYTYRYVHVHIKLCLQESISICIYTHIDKLSGTYMETRVQDVCVRKILYHTLLISLHSTRDIHRIMYSNMVFMFFTIMVYLNTYFLCHWSMATIYHLKMNGNDNSFKDSPMI